MKDFLKRVEKETLWGGIFGIIALLAIFAELLLGGISVESLIAAVKEVAGTVVAVLVFFVAAKHILKQLQEAKTFEERLQKALDNWQVEHANMVVRKEQYDYEKSGAPASCFSFGLKTNVSDFYKNAETNNTGWFLRMPLLKKENYQAGNVALKFHLNKGTFFEGVEMTKEELAAGYNKLNGLFKEFIAGKFPDQVQVTGKDQDIVVTIVKPVETAEGIELLLSVIDSMYNAYLVAANLR